MDDRTEAFAVFTAAFTLWAQRIKKIQADSLEAYAALAYWSAIASISSNLSQTADHLARQCNKHSGYQIDLGEMSDVFEQQRQWNKKHLGDSRKTRTGDEQWN
jgi:hypothetical protein